MAKARALDKRRKSIRNIRKITRTMELIATAQFKKAMDRATAATAFTQADHAGRRRPGRGGLEVSHPLLEAARRRRRTPRCWCSRPTAACAAATTAACIRGRLPRCEELKASVPNCRLEVAGKRGIAAFKFRKIDARRRPTRSSTTSRSSTKSMPIANRYLDEYVTGKLDRLDVAYTKFVSSIASRWPSSRRCCRWARWKEPKPRTKQEQPAAESMYEFLPSAESILEEVVPASFKVKLFKCFLDAAVSEQIARMVAMKSATENASRHDQEPVDAATTAPARARSPARSWRSSAASKP